MIDAKQLSDCRELVLAVAPELRVQPLYIVDATEVAGLNYAINCLGCVPSLQIMDRNIADRLGKRYRGPGNVIVLDAVAIEHEAEPGGFERCLRSVVTHEVGHLVPVRNVFEPADTPRVRQLFIERMERGAKLPEPQPGSLHYMHGPEFIRRVTHATFRAIVGGYDVAIDGVYGPFNWMSTACVYLTILLAECHRLAGASFAEIMATMPPEQFTKQWGHDLEIYRRYQEYWNKKEAENANSDN